MPKQLMRGLVLTLAAVFSFALVPSIVLAHDGETENETENTTTTERKEALAEAKAERLTAVKLKVCENRKEGIIRIMSRAAVRADNQLKVFNTIAERVEAFYVKKGKVLAGYDELVAAVTEAKTKAQTDIDALKNMDTFTCDSEDPKGSIDDFKATLKTVKEDLKAYRTAVKNLIVGVKSVQSTQNDDNEGTGGDQ